jgi:glycosyltransferase involved in cell wall biosynthesis
VAALAAAIGELVDAPDIRRRFGEMSRRIAEAEFSLGHVVRETLRVYGAAGGP